MEEWRLNDLLENFKYSHYFDKTKVDRLYSDYINKRLTSKLYSCVEDTNLVRYRKALKKKGINLITNEYPDNKYISIRGLHENCYITSDIEFANIFELEYSPALMKITNHNCEDEWVESNKYNQIMIRYYKLTPDGKVEIKQKIYKKVENIKKGFGYLLDNFYMDPYNIDYCADCHPYDMNIFIPYNSKGFAHKCAFKLYYDSMENSQNREQISKVIIAMCGINSMSVLSINNTFYAIKDWYCFRKFDRDVLKRNTYYD